MAVVNVRVTLVKKSCVQCTTVEQHVGLGLGDRRAVPGCTDAGPLRLRYRVLPQALAFAVRSLRSRAASCLAQREIDVTGLTTGTPMRHVDILVMVCRRPNVISGSVGIGILL